jgi:hypothetical protein
MAHLHHGHAQTLPVGSLLLGPGEHRLRQHGRPGAEVVHPCSCVLASPSTAPSMRRSMPTSRRRRPPGSVARPGCCGRGWRCPDRRCRTRVPPVADQHDLIFSSVTCTAPHQRPLRFDVWIAITPWPPRPVAAGNPRDRRALAVAVLGGGQDMALVEDDQRDHLLVIGPRRMPRTPAAVRPMGARRILAKRMPLPAGAEQHDVALPSVIATSTRRSSSRRSTAMMPLVRGRENADSGVFLTVPRRGHEDELLVVELAHRQHRVDALALQRQQIDDRLAARAAADLRQFVDLEPVALAAAGEAQQIVSWLLATNSLSMKSSPLTWSRELAAAAAALGLVGIVQRLGLHSRVGQGDHHVLVGDQVLDGEIAVILVDLGAARSPYCSLIRLSSSRITWRRALGVGRISVDPE